MQNVLFFDTIRLDGEVQSGQQFEETYCKLKILLEKTVTAFFADLSSSFEDFYIFGTVEIVWKFSTSLKLLQLKNSIIVILNHKFTIAAH